MKTHWAWRRIDGEETGAPTTKAEAQAQVKAWGGKLQRVKVLS